ncbi:MULTISPECIES: UTRA domain-containing protein [unclassified Streptomyces]|uniref:GntR family transcriptional regulator n=1 Tax=unclassified Streptomyces TaxID=2593676 RepID=UPI0016105860|nr:UTRA domain-containing protein [Streptomyces sp. I6]
MRPKWKVLTDRLAGEIRDGTRPPGSVLPRIVELVAAGDGSKATVNRAYKELESAGLVTSMRGRGTVVREPARVRLPLSRFQHALEAGGARGPWEMATADQGLDGRMQVDNPAAEFLDAPGDVAEFLGLTPGALVVRRRRRALIGADVIALQDAWYPLDVAEAAGLDSPDKIAGGTLGALADAGIVPAQADEHVTADAPTDEQSANLAVGTRAAVLLVDRVTRDETGRAIELVRLVGAANRLTLVYAPLPLKTSAPRGQPG